MSTEESVSRWIEEVKRGNDDAAQKIWDRYFPDLLDLARRRLGVLPRREADEEDVALSALNSFFLAAAKNRFPDLEDREGLWRLLSWITQRKAVSLIRRTLSQKRGGGKVRGDSAFGSGQNSTGTDLAAAAVECVTPELIELMRDQCQHLLDLLGEDRLKSVALAKVQGYTNAETASMLDVAESTVELRLRVIRGKWEEIS